MAWSIGTYTNSMIWFKLNGWFIFFPDKLVFGEVIHECGFSFLDRDMRYIYCHVYDSIIHKIETPYHWEIDSSHSLKKNYQLIRIIGVKICFC